MKTLLLLSSIAIALSGCQTKGKKPIEENSFTVLCSEVTYRWRIREENEPDIAFSIDDTGKLVVYDSLLSIKMLLDIDSVNNKKIDNLNLKLNLQK